MVLFWMQPQPHNMLWKLNEQFVIDIIRNLENQTVDRFIRFRVKIEMVNYRKQFFVALVSKVLALNVYKPKNIFRNEIKQRNVENTNVVH